VTFTLATVAGGNAVNTTDTKNGGTNNEVVISCRDEDESVSELT